MVNKLTTATLFLAIILLFTGRATAFFHNYNINELYSNTDGSLQFIELINGNVNGEMFSAGQLLTVTQGGASHSFTFPSNLPSSATANTTVLLATQSFADLAIVTPDFIIPAGFLFIDGGKLNLGTAVFDSITYAALPTGGNLSMNRNGTTGVNSPKNFAGAIGTVPAPPQVLNLGLGWNLVSAVVVVDVPALMGDPGTFTTIWKWENDNWAVYLPGEASPGTFAASKGFAQLAAINPGEGFWVNTAGPTQVTLSGTPVSGELTLISGWTLAGLKSPQAVTVGSLVAATPTIISVWTWTQDNWAVYLSGEATPGAYAASKGFGVLDVINPGEGFWVNKQ